MIICTVSRVQRGVLSMRRASEGFRGAVGVLFIDFGGGFMELNGVSSVIAF